MSAPDAVTHRWQVATVPPEDLDLVWPAVARDLARTLRRGAGHTLDLEDLRSSVRDGRRILWVVHRGDQIGSSLVLEFVRHPSREVVLRVVAIAGARFWEWAETVQALLVDLAEISGATRLEAIARPGMARWLRKLGWSSRAVHMDLSIGRCNG